MIFFRRPKRILFLCLLFLGANASHAEHGRANLVRLAVNDDHMAALWVVDKARGKIEWYVDVFAFGNRREIRVEPHFLMAHDGSLAGFHLCKVDLLALPRGEFALAILDNNLNVSIYRLSEQEKPSRLTTLVKLYSIQDYRSSLLRLIRIAPNSSDFYLAISNPDHMSVDHVQTTSTHALDIDQLRPFYITDVKDNGKLTLAGIRIKFAQLTARRDPNRIFGYLPPDPDILVPLDRASKDNGKDLKYEVPDEVLRRSEDILKGAVAKLEKELNISADEATRKMLESFSKLEDEVGGEGLIHQLEMETQIRILETENHYELIFATQSPNQGMRLSARTVDGFFYRSNFYSTLIGDEGKSLIHLSPINLRDGTALFQEFPAKDFSDASPIREGRFVDLLGVISWLGRLDGDEGPKPAYILRQTPHLEPYTTFIESFLDVEGEYASTSEVSVYENCSFVFRSK